MAAREDEAQPVIGDVHRVLRLDRIDRFERGDELGLPGDLGRLLHEAPASAQPIDRAIARGGRDPGTGIRGDAALRPGLQGGDERLLDGLLGKVEVTEDPDQGRDRSALLLAEQAIDDLVGGGQLAPALAPAASVASMGAPIPVSDQSTIGRTSTEPVHAPGMRAAYPMASSRSAASTM